jgi:putative inorganic carbon (hco3(-)) transporter
LKALLFTYALTYGGAAASVLFPYVGFLIYVCFGILKPDSLWFWAIPQGSYSRIVAIGLLAGWVLHGMGRWEFGRAKGVIFSLLGYWAVVALSAMTAPHPDLAWPRVEALSKVFLPLIVGLTLIDSMHKLKQLMWVIVLSQGFLAYEFNLTYYTQFFLPSEFMHGGLDNNGIAITMVTSIGMAFFLGMHSARWWQRALAFGLAALMAHVVLFSHSRGGMVALIITGFACFLLIPKQPRHYLAFAVALALVLRLAGEGVQERFSTIFIGQEEGGDQGGKRLEHWAACWDSMQKHPLGVGLNHWPVTAPQYGLPLGMAAHTTWLQIGAELGYPGLLLLIGFYGICMWRLWTLTRNAPTRQTQATPIDPWFQYGARMVIASLAGFFVAAQFVTVDGIELPYYITLFGAGLLKLSSLPAVTRHDSPTESALTHAALGTGFRE